MCIKPIRKKAPLFFKRRTIGKAFQEKDDFNVTSQNPDRAVSIFETKQLPFQNHLSCT